MHIAKSFLLLFQSANYLVHCSPGCCPGLYTSWGFAPSLLTASTVAQHLELSCLLGLRPVFVQRGVYVWNPNRDVTVVLLCLLLLFQNTLYLLSYFCGYYLE